MNVISMNAGALQCRFCVFLRTSAIALLSSYLRS